MAWRAALVQLREVSLLGRAVQVLDTPRYRDFWDQVHNDQWEKTTLSAIDTLVNEGSTYIDIGSWIGPTVLVAARRAKRVIAYEPDPVACDELRANVAANSLTNVEIRQVALFDKNAKLPFGPGYSPELGGSESTLVFGNSELTVDARDVREEVNGEEFLSADLVKIDVEGAEYTIVPLMGPYLHKVRPKLLLSLHSIAMTRRPNVKSRVAAALLRRAAFFTDRLRLILTLKSYRHCYLDAGATFEELPLSKRTKLSLDWFRNDGLYFANAPLPPFRASRAP